mgnify:CR=1 FL=1|tara:strand:- start:2304 stop:2498 length:195 start_codon:yes stop_codon:yes gene_type:complete
MTERTEQFISSIWEKRNEGADTEEKLVAEILKLTAETIKYYTAQDGRIVLDKEDLLNLAEELNG